MASAKRGLGRGLDSLIPKAVNAPAEKKAESKAATTGEEKVNTEANIVKVKITKVEPNRDQPRKTFNEDTLQELADSIKQFGVIEPLLVQDKGDHYEIIGGERRWRASKLAGLKEVPVIIKDYSEREKAEIALIDNIQRENLNPIDEALAYKRLLTEFHLKQDEVAERVSKSRTAVTNSMRLLKLCDEVQQMIVDEMITTGHARTLITVENPADQYELAQKIFDEKLSVREAEKLVRDLGKEKKPKKDGKLEDKTIQLIYQDIENRMKSSLGTKVSIEGKGDGTGKIEIEFYSNDELDRLTELLTHTN